MRTLISSSILKAMGVVVLPVVLRHPGVWAFLAVLCLPGFSSCSYTEEMELCTLTVRLQYPDNTIDPYAGARVELRSIGHSAVFVDSTDTEGTARFTVTPGIYEASSTAQFLDTATATWWRYNFNGVKSMIIVAPDSANVAEIILKSSRKRVIH